MNADWIIGADGFTAPDDLIPRVMRNGFRATEQTLKVAPTQRTEAFRKRVQMARAQLRNGSTVAEIRSEHGSIVLRVAQSSDTPLKGFAEK